MPEVTPLIDEERVTEIAQLAMRDGGLTGEIAERAIRTAIREAGEAAAKLCEDMQEAKSAPLRDGRWLTLGTTEIGGSTFAAAIRARLQGK